MKRTGLRLSSLFLVLLLGLSDGLRAEPQTRYTNAQLVSINAPARQVVIRDTEGKQQRLQLDDTVASLEGLRAGDSVILTLREEPGVTRISSIVKSVAPPTAPAAPVERPADEGAAGSTVAAASAFDDRVAALAEQAGQVDALWRNFVSACNVTLRSSYPGGRDWFSLWEEGAAQVDLSGGFCRDLFNQVVSRGEGVKAGMTTAEEVARKADLAPGEMRETRQRHSLEWGGFGLPAPEPLKP